MKGVILTLNRDNWQNQISVKGLHLWLIVTRMKGKGYRSWVKLLRVIIEVIIICHFRQLKNLKNYSQLSRKTQIIASNFFQFILYNKYIN